MRELHQKIKGFFGRLGPGFITGASDDDPSGIGTYSQAGARFGLQTLWMALFSLPFMIAVQEMCGRIGLVSGKGLAEVIKEHYGKTFLSFTVTVLLVANVVNIAADLGAMAGALQLLVKLPFTWLLILITTLTLVLEIFVSYGKYAKFLKWLGFSLLAYIVTAILVTTNWSTALSDTFVPHISFTKEYLMIVVAILGTTISPYLFFWQASEEVEEELMSKKLAIMDEGAPTVTAEDVRVMRSDTFWGMLISNLIMFFIILTAANTLFPAGIFTIETAPQAAEALRPLAGNLTFWLFALGIVGTGLLAIPILAGSCSYAISESFGWKAGLSEKPSRAPGFYTVLGIATVLSLLINFFSGIEPFRLLFYAAILNGVVAPPLIFLILRITNRRDIMGDYVNSRLSNVLGYAIAAIMGVAAIALIFTSL